MSGVSTSLHMAASESREWVSCLEEIRVFAHRKLAGRDQRLIDPEDIAASVMRSYLGQLGHSDPTRLRSQMPLFKTMVGRKISRALRKGFAAKRGFGRVRGESVLGLQATGGGIDQLASPTDAASDTEGRSQLLDLLPNDDLRRIAELRSEGRCMQEIAKQLECGLRTVERRIDLIRGIWSDALAAQ